MDTFNARMEAFRLAKEKYHAGDTTHSKYSSIYIAPTSNVKDALKQYKDYKNVLSVGGTGAYGYEAALNGAQKVDMFDTNILQRMYYEILQMAIYLFDYEDFIKHFSIINTEELAQKRNVGYQVCNVKDFLSNECFRKLAWYLPDDVFEVFEPIYEFYDSKDLILSKLFRFEYQFAIEHLKQYASMYNEEEFYRLKEIIRKDGCKFAYDIVDLVDVPKHYDKKYDLIILDNILQYYKNIPELNTPYLVNMFIQKKLSNLLADDGVILANYAFEIGTDAVKSKFDIPMKRELSSLEKIIVQREIKEGINIPLIDKWDGYSYEFIPGVEFADNNVQSDNMVLSWRKINR